MSTAVIPFSNPEEIRTLFGAQDVNLRRIRDEVGVSAVLRGDVLTLEGDEAQVRRGQEVVESLQSIIARRGDLTEQDVSRTLNHTAAPDGTQPAIDLFEKKDDYARYGVREYLVLCVQEREIRWFNLSHGHEKQPVEDGIIRIETFPGLWIDAESLLSRNAQQLFETMEQGLATREHAEFVAQLAEARQRNSPG